MFLYGTSKIGMVFRFFGALSHKHSWILEIIKVLLIVLVSVISWCIWKERNNICFVLLVLIQKKNAKTTRAIILTVNARLYYWTGMSKKLKVNWKREFENGCLLTRTSSFCKRWMEIGFNRWLVAVESWRAMCFFLFFVL